MNHPATSGSVSGATRLITFLTMFALLASIFGPLSVLAEDVGTPPDSIAPVLTLPADLTVEAAVGEDFASVSYDVSAIDETDGAVEVSCDAVSGSAFPIGTSTVTCSATDAAGNEGSGSFFVTVSAAPQPEPTATAEIVSEPSATTEPAAPTATNADDQLEPAATNTVAPSDPTSTTAPAEPTATTQQLVVYSGPPTIKSDLEDYPPGGRVTLNGSNWQPGETVNIYVNDDWGSSWNRRVDVIADESGEITDAFNLPDWFVAEYSVVATGSISGVALTTFTDARVILSVTLNGGPSVAVAANASINAALSVTTDGTGANARWRSTSWRISTTVPGTVTCANHVDFDSAGSHGLTIAISAPSTPGTYNAYFQAHADDTCGAAGGGASSLVTMSNAVTVQAATQSTTVGSITASNSIFAGNTDLSATVSPSGVAGSVAFFVNGSLTAIPATYNSTTGIATVSNYVHGLNVSVTAYSVRAVFTSANSGFTGSQATNNTALTVNKADQTITFGPLGNKTYGDAAFTVSATASSGLNVSFNSTTLPVCTVSGATVTIVAAEICTIRASRPGMADPTRLRMSTSHLPSQRPTRRSRRRARQQDLRRCAIRRQRYRWCLWQPGYLLSRCHR